MFTPIYRKHISHHHYIIIDNVKSTNTYREDNNDNFFCFILCLVLESTNGNPIHPERAVMAIHVMAAADIIKHIYTCNTQVER
jgi:hypothetical protein